MKEIFKDFNKVSEQYELKRSLEVWLGDVAYRLEVFTSHSSLKPSWSVRVYTITENHHFKHIGDFPWTDERDEETAIRVALSFLEERPN